MARGRPAAALTLLLALLGAPGGARAGATVDLLFVGVNGAPIAATNNLEFGAIPGDVVTMAVVMRNDVPLTVAVFSLHYDTDGDNELDVLQAFQWHGVALDKSGTDFFQPLSGLSPVSTTFVGSFQGATVNLSLPRVLPPAAGAFAGGYQMGTVTWKVNFGWIDGADIVSGLLHFGIDAFADGGFNDMGGSVQFSGASVGVPEPAAGALLGVGLGALALWCRRRRGSR
jgi:hypothetical protein